MAGERLKEKLVFLNMQQEEVGEITQEEAVSWFNKAFEDKTEEELKKIRAKGQISTDPALAQQVRGIIAKLKTKTNGVVVKKTIIQEIRDTFKTD